MSEELTNKEKKISYVAKISMDPRDNNGELPCIAHC